jgi:putative effector of murein hydrolase LrgA (UPF0299 family)
MVNIIIMKLMQLEWINLELKWIKQVSTIIFIPKPIFYINFLHLLDVWTGDIIFLYYRVLCINSRAYFIFL